MAVISKCMICMRGEDRLYDSICLALEMNLWASKMVGWIMIEQDSSIDMEEEKKTSLKKKTKPLALLNTSKMLLRHAFPKREKRMILSSTPEKFIYTQRRLNCLN